MVKLIRPDPTDVLKQLVATPSLSGEEAELAKLVLDLATSWNLSAEPAGRNVVIRVGADAGPRLLLNSHLDTVAPVAGWPHDPFTPLEDDGRISGLGANDAKGCVTAMLCAAAGFVDRLPSGQVVLALTVDEEIGGGGDGLEKLIDRLGRLDAAVIGEPTNLDICCAQKGLLILELETTGMARHAAHAHRLPGPNAIQEAARAIAALDGWSPGPDHPLLGPVTCHVTTIEGGTRRNVIPDRCVFCLDIRTVDDDAIGDIVDGVRSITGAEVRVRSDRLRSFNTDPDSVISHAARRARPESKIIGSATLSDAVWTRHLPTVKIGPGQTERSHTAGEWVTRSELEAGVVFYARLIEEYFAEVGS
jgi:acetylornithine deacetylase